jgi:hypothetical protein
MPGSSYVIRFGVNFLLCASILFILQDMRREKTSFDGKFPETKK